MSEHCPCQTVGITTSQEEKMGREGIMYILRPWMQIFQILSGNTYQRNFQIEYECNLLSKFQGRS